MLLIDAANAERYLRDTGRVGAADAVEITPLAGGVSNEVLYVAFSGEPARDFVLKQARPQLRVADPWFCGVDRIWGEVEVLRICERVLAESRDASLDQALRARTPRILFEDRKNYCFGMEAAPREHTVWKRGLLGDHSERGKEPHLAAEETLRCAQDETYGGKAPGENSNEEIAEQCGRLLAALHGGTWRDTRVAAALDDRRVFDELRLDPYYRMVARRFPDAAPRLHALVDSVWGRRLCLVHGDFSPKNLLVFSGGLMMVDFETGHYGDPAFDLGFFLSHLVLKAVYHAPRHKPLLELTEQFWSAYWPTLTASVLRRPLGQARGEGDVGAVPGPAFSAQAQSDLERHAILNFAGCGWARLDGKSPVEYLTDPTRREQARSLFRWVLEDSPPVWDDVLARCRITLGSI